MTYTADVDAHIAVLARQAERKTRVNRWRTRWWQRGIGCGRPEIDVITRAFLCWDDWLFAEAALRPTVPDKLFALTGAAVVLSNHTEGIALFEAARAAGRMGQVAVEHSFRRALLRLVERVPLGAQGHV